MTTLSESILSVESQMGIIRIQQCSIENKKGAVLQLYKVYDIGALLVLNNNNNNSTLLTRTFLSNHDTQGAQI